MSLPINHTPGWYVCRLAELVAMRDRQGNTAEDRELIGQDIHEVCEAYHRRLVNLAAQAGGKDST